MICIGQFWLLSTEIRLSFVAACFVPMLQQTIYRTGVYRKALCQFLYADALIVSFQNQFSSFIVQHSSHLLCLCYTSFCLKVKVLCCIIENCYKCRYGERGAADAVPQPPERCLSRKAGIVRCCLWNSVLWNAVFCTVSERSRPFPTERYIMCNERITCSVGRDTLIPPRRNLVGLCCACKPSVKLHKTNDLLFPRLFPNTIPKRPQFAAQCQIISVGIYDQICLVQAELAAFVQQALVHIHGNDFSQKQVVAA